MLKIGLTGGIGSGKSIIAQLYSVLGAPVFNSDKEAATIVNTDKTAIGQIKVAFGDDIYKGALLDRKKLAKIVFTNASRLQELNNIVHPLVNRHYAKWLQQHSNKPYTIKEAAILFESGSYQDCDKVITVSAPLELRIRRVIMRDNVSRQDVEKRIHNQWSEEERIKHSDYIIYNDDTQLVIPQAIALHENIISCSNS